MSEFINDMAAQYVIEQADPRTRWQKFVAWLFPSRRCPIPDAPAEWKDRITTRTVTKLSLADWLRCMVTGVVCVDVKIATENEVGATRTETVAYIGTKRDLA